MNKSVGWIVDRVTERLSIQLGACIKRLRCDREWSQTDFGERCGFYQTYLSRVETGKANPTANAMEVMAAALGLSIFDLFDEIRRDTAKSPIAKAVVKWRAVQ